MKCFSISVISLLSTAAIVSANTFTFVNRRRRATLTPITQPQPTKTLLELRGGAINTKALTNVLTANAIAQGFVQMEAPQVAVESYGFKDTSKYTLLLSQQIGAGILSVGVLALCLFTMKMDAIKAIGWSLMVWVYQHISFLLNLSNTKDEIKISPLAIVAWLAFGITCVHASFTDASYASNLLTAQYGLFALSTCIPAICFPKGTAKIYGQDKLTNDQVVWCRGFGFQNLALCTFCLSLLRGTCPHKSLGYSCLPVITHIALGLMSGDVKGDGATAVIVGTLIFHVIAFATLVSQ